ncbi:MAG: ABC transporter ATP-binding protein [Candidatus Bathyarchaeia archaeon]
MGAPIISTRELVKYFGNTAALQGLNLNVPCGISGFIGPNGAGKTTTINILLGLLKPDYGEATVFGLDCWRESFKIRRRVGVLHENNAYPGNFTGIRFLEHVANIYGFAQAKKRAKEILSEVGLSEAADKPIKAYSAGMRQRLGLAQALIGDPDLVILDEPTANIDPLGRILLLDKIKEIHSSRGTSFLISTHILPELEKICSWVSIINKGRIVDQGYVRDLSAKYSANIYRIEVSNPHLLADRIREMEIVEEVWVEGENVYCRVKDLNRFYGEIPKIIADLNLQLRSFQYMRSSLEEVYREAFSWRVKADES